MSAGGRHLVLVLPGLCGPDSDPPLSDYLSDARPDALDRLLSRSRVRPGSGRDLDTTLGRLFGLDAALEVPIAALTWLADTGRPPAGWLMRADPVHLRADQSSLRLFDSHSFRIERTEADALVAAFNEFYRARGLVLSAPRPQRWYLALSRAPGLVMCSPSRCAGQAIDPCLPQGAEAARWHALLNEIQMLFHDHPVNRAREARGEPAINSIWPWGGGELPGALQVQVSRVLANQPLAAGLARHARLPLERIPDSAAGLPAGGGRTLLVDDRLEWPMRYGDIESWLDALQALEADWFMPLLAALRRGALASLEFHPCNGRCYRLTRAGLRAFWVPRRRFEALCEPR